ncbi:translation protein SH3-like domain-containing protein [Radiomyces spectabilis]|uniref:translation protein SH3-like domain-containing protein n=1 Tax=Radiomyces spectabilis TaxID=64574 RepID=UPI00221ECF26|nr:translation protein SH3-like domain-containing protein [Radiomyces spectabilis]KAI8394076.1 translation protein SH3-like domain-containing protein [Radiomyces spectabilis]
MNTLKNAVARLALPRFALARPACVARSPYTTAATATSASTKGNVMELITQQQIQKANTDGRAELFDRKNPQGVKPGSILMVETLNGPGESTSSTFMGVCIAIRRKGIDTSFTLRNIVMRIGVEQRYSLYSPLLKSVKVLQAPNELKFRRAKLYYLRDQPGKAFQPLQSLWKQEQNEKMANKK